MIDSDRIIKLAEWHEHEASCFCKYHSNLGSMPELAEMHEETATVLRELMTEHTKLREQLEEAIERGNDWCDQAHKAREIVAIANSVCGKNNCNCPGAKKVRNAIDGALEVM